MQIDTLKYCITQGMKNIWQNKIISSVSLITISACIFLFCLFYSIVVNVQHLVHMAENSLGIMVFFEDELEEEDILSIGQILETREEIYYMNFISAEEAWENFQERYFEGMQELAEGFAQDNPLANSASFEIFLYDIQDQIEFAHSLEELDGVRRVNYSSVAVEGMISFNQIITVLSIAIIGILLLVSTFLINNTISLAISVRREEIKIMRLIGAENFMIRAPFVIEGLVLGVLGVFIPILSVHYLYAQSVSTILERFQPLASIIEFLPIREVVAVIIPVSLLLGVGIGLVGSFFAVRRHLTEKY